MQTFVYGSDLDYYPKDKFIADHPVEGKDFLDQGELTDDEFKNLLECLKESNAVKRGIKRLL